MKGLEILRRLLLLVSAPLFFVNFSIPVQAKQLGANAIEIGALFSLFTFSLLILRPLVGIGLDRYGRRPFLVAALVVYSLSNLFYGFAADVSLMYVARILHGIGASLLLITVDSITADLTHAGNRAAEMGRNIEVQTRSSIVGATLGFTLLGAIPAYAWSLSFGTFSLVAFVAVVIAVVSMPETKQADSMRISLELTISPGMWRFLFIVFLSAFASALIQPIYLIYLQDTFNLPVQDLAIAFLPAAIVFAVLPSRLGKLSDRFGTRMMFCVGMAIAGCVYLVLPEFNHFIVFVIVYTVSAIGWAISDPARKALTADYGEEGNQGQVFGTTELVAGVAATLGPLIGGYIYESVNAAATFYANGVLLVITALVAFLLLDRTSRT